MKAVSGYRLQKTFVIERLEAARSAIAPLKHDRRFSQAFKQWRRDTQVLLRNAFGDDSTHVEEFNSISYNLAAYANTTPDHRFQEAYVRGLESADAVLTSMIAEVGDYWSEDPEPLPTAGALEITDRIATRFHTVVRQLRRRHAERPTLVVTDEYDVQDLLHALLRLWFDDIRAEEWTPSYAGGSSRVDFLLKEERTVIEVKKTRESLSARKLGEELIIDIERYRVHPDCSRLICFVYDPDGRIVNPAGIASDLSGARDGLDVQVCIRPI